MIGGRVFGGGVFPTLQQGALLNQIDEADLDDNNFIVSEEGYLLVEPDNIESFIISED